VDQTRFSTIAHTDHLFLCPLSMDKAEELIDALDLAENDRILDVGCGKGELLVRIVERCAVTAVGLEPNPAFAAIARRWATRRGHRVQRTIRTARRSSASRFCIRGGL